MQNEKLDRERILERKRQNRRRRRRRKRRNSIVRRRMMFATMAVAVTGIAIIIGAAIMGHQATAGQQEIASSEVPRLSVGVSAEISEAFGGRSEQITRATVDATPALAPMPTPAATTTPEVMNLPEMEEESAEAIWTGWTFFESGYAGWEQVEGDGGNAYGRFQLDARHSLAAFLRYAAEVNPDFVGLERYYRSSGDTTTLKSTDGLADDWVWLCAVYGDDFYRAQAEFAYGVYYCLMRDGLLEQYGIDLDAYGPVLKGTVWSVAVRNGNNLSSIYSVTETYDPGIDEEEWLREIYAIEAERHPDQAQRWEGGQLDAALSTLEMLESGVEVEFHYNFEKDAVTDTGRIECLLLDGDYRDFVRYTGRKV